ncbi:polyprenyl synthetase family protein [Candidatus Liberibacter americanus]|uniref:Probable farnesyl diphosphate synthase n=1 Tax=Candidatus Liberibacter americanus str. Sao Paulo TaxID=1261131 RepID=U6B8Z2_9HYPH|nr:polyprenyl synthetase family protein [Candidatus Liberibacter americanus]AHA28182.1 Geranylgeranyl pyrophosphate synthase [Candidatus Liberibacter americanus str. Sao Paulo]EMS36301.1 geranyltranstransferase protein [Candidatus Liberibacter americanus PW_SP]
MNDIARLKLQDNSKRIESILDRLLSRENFQCKSHNDRLISAMRYAILNGGKKLRSFLLVECAALFEFYDPVVLQIGAAIECIHCYSLIHDDLPSMDDGHIRRGKPTVHIKYDEATAILSGNSLLTYAFEIIFSPKTKLEDKIRCELAFSLSCSSGAKGMLGGQMMDVQDEYPDENNPFIVPEMKTGALMRFACEAGAIIANASQEDKIRLRNFGNNLGIIFQLVDDILDFKSNTHKVDKKSMKNATNKKNCLIKIKGEQWIKQEIDKQTNSAIDILSCYGKKSQPLIEFARFLSS